MLAPLITGKKKPRDLELEPDTVNVTLTCLSMIMLLLFIFLNSLTTPNHSRKEAVLTSLHQFFPRKVQKKPLIPSDTLQSGALPPAGEAGPTADAERYPVHFKTLETLLAPSGFVVSHQPGSFTARIHLNQVFGENNDQIRAQIISTLSRMANQASNFNLRVEVSAFTEVEDSNTENFPLRTSGPSGLELAGLRAMALVRFFIDHNLPAENISGGGKPVKALSTTADSGAAGVTPVSPGDLLLIIREHD